MTENKIEVEAEFGILVPSIQFGNFPISNRVKLTRIVKDGVEEATQELLEQANKQVMESVLRQKKEVDKLTLEHAALPVDTINKFKEMGFLR
jgi:hypothetical protein